MGVYIIDDMKKKKNKKDIPIARIFDYDKEEEKLSKKPKRCVFFNEDKSIGEQTLKCSDNEKFLLYPYKTKNQVFTCLICGGQGSGKSYISVQFVEQLLDEFPDIKNVFYLTASSRDDTVHDKLKKRMNKRKEKVITGKGRNKKIEEIEIEEPIFIQLNPENTDLYDMDIDIFENSIFLIDDFEKLKDMQLQKLLFHFVDRLTNMGRKCNINVVQILHKLKQRGGRNAETILESNFITTFPNHSWVNTESFCYYDLGWKPKRIEQLKNLDTRSLTFHKAYPNYYVSDREISLF